MAETAALTREEVDLLLDELADRHRKCKGARTRYENALEARDEVIRAVFDHASTGVLAHMLEMDRTRVWQIARGR